MSTYTDYVTETRTIGDFTAEVLYETEGYPFSPRDNDGCYTDLVLFHNRYDLPNDLDMNADDYDGWDDMEAAIRREYPDVVVCLPVAGHDHSSFHVYIGSTYDRWDGGRVGFVVIRRSRIAEFQGEKWAKRITAAKRADLETWAAAELQEYDDWANGNLYWWRVLDADGETVDSCSGYIGDEGEKYALSEAIACAESEARHRAEENLATRERLTIERLIGFTPVLDRLPVGV